jgi:hypothetical protein
MKEKSWNPCATRLLTSLTMEESERECSFPLKLGMAQKEQAWLHPSAILM